MTDDVKIRIGADDKASAKIKGINKSTANLSKTLKVAALAMTAMGIGVGLALTKMVNNYSQAGDAVAKMAKRTGFGVEMLSELRHVANLSGTTIESLEIAMRRMSRVADQAGRGMENEYTKRLKQLGIEVDKFIAMPQEEKFWLIVDALAAIEDPAVKVAAAYDLFGDSGTKLLPIIDSGTAAIADMRQETHDLNLVFSVESARAAEDFEDSKTRMKGALEGLANVVAVTVMPEFERFIKLITERLNVAMGWLDEHPEAIGAFIKFAGIVGTGGMVFLAVTQFIKMLAAMRTTLITIHALMGPKGWAVLAGALGLSTAAVAGFKTIETSALAEPVIPSMQHGGVVPGPIGQPRLIVAHGQERYLGAGGWGSDLHVHVHTEVFSGREEDARAFARKIHQILREENRVGTVGRSI